MSTLVVEVCRIEKIEDHPNADRMKIATVKGWKTCIRYDPQTGETEFEVRDKCVFFPPDSVLPPELVNGPADEPPGRLDVMKYLQPLRKDSDGTRPPGGRVRAACLRGVPSYGIVMRLDSAWGDDPDWEVGTDVASHYGVTKWEPPLVVIEGDFEPPHPNFHQYTSIESYGNFPTAIRVGTEVVFTEKIHGKNCRLGLIHATDEEGEPSWVWMAGSHNVRRKEFDAKGRRSEFWEVLTDNVKTMLCHVRDHFPRHEAKQSVILFGEIYGSGVQDMAYGYTKGQRDFRAFDIAIDSRYIDFETKVELLNQFGIEMVPVVYRGPFDPDVLESHTSGPTILCPPQNAGKFKGREGIVVTPIEEQLSDVLGDRLILKSVSADYLARKGGTDFH